MGENVLAALQEYARVLATDPPAPGVGDATGSVYFDLWGRAMVSCHTSAVVVVVVVVVVVCVPVCSCRHPCLYPQLLPPLTSGSPCVQVIYSHKQAKALHHAPLAVLLLLPLLTPAAAAGKKTGGAFGGAGRLTWLALAGDALLALASLLAALLVPAAVGFGRAAASGEHPTDRLAGCVAAAAAAAAASLAPVTLLQLLMPVLCDPNQST